MSPNNLKVFWIPLPPWAVYHHCTGRNPRAEKRDAAVLAGSYDPVSVWVDMVLLVLQFLLPLRQDWPYQDMGDGWVSIGLIFQEKWEIDLVPALPRASLRSRTRESSALCRWAKQGWGPGSQFRGQPDVGLGNLFSIASQQKRHLSFNGFGFIAWSRHPLI